MKTLIFIWILLLLIKPISWISKKTKLQKINSIDAENAIKYTQIVMAVAFIGFVLLLAGSFIYAIATGEVNASSVGNFKIY